MIDYFLSSLTVADLIAYALLFASAFVLLVSLGDPIVERWLERRRLQQRSAGMLREVRRG